MLILFSLAIFSWIILRWPIFFHRGIPSYAIIGVFIIKTIAGYFSYQYHSIYFAGGDGAIYLNGGYDLVNYSGGNPLKFMELFLNLNRGVPGWESIYEKIIYWDSTSTYNLINDNRNAIRVNALVSLFSFKNLGVHLLILNFLSLIGLNALYITFEKWFPKVPSILIFIAVFLSPSILFWTSGILKETHTIFFIGLFFLSLNKLLLRPNIKTIIPFLIFLYLLLLVRSYFAITVILSVLFLFISLLVRNQEKRLALSFMIYIPIVLLAFYALDITRILAEKQHAFILIGENANSYFSISRINNSWDLLLHLPKSLLNVFLQTQLFSFDSWLYIFPIIENIDVFCLFLIALFFRNKLPSSSLFFLVFISLIYLFNASLIGLTVPIQGAISRYKAISQPFLIMALISLVDWKRIRTIYFDKTGSRNPLI